MERKITEDQTVSISERTIKQEETWQTRMASYHPVHNTNTYTVYSDGYHFPYCTYRLASYCPYYSNPYAVFGPSTPSVLPVFGRRRAPSSLAIPSDRTKPTCQICMKTFTRMSSLKVHMRIHRGEKPFTCSECGKAFSQSGNLKVHMYIHNGSRPYECELCGRSFSQSSSLKSHIRSHRNQKGERGINPSIASENNTASLDSSVSSNI